MEELARVYGRSLFEVASEQDKLDLLREQLGQFADALEQSNELRVFFFSPYFSSKEKQDALGGLLQGADAQLVNFLELLIENHRMPVVFRVRREYERLWEQENKLLAVEITSAIELGLGHHRQFGRAHRRARRTQGEADRACQPRHPGRNRVASGQLDLGRLYS